MRKVTRSNLKNGRCNVNVNTYDRKGKNIRSEQYKGISSVFGNVTRIKKTGQTPKYKR